MFGKIIAKYFPELIYRDEDYSRCSCGRLVPWNASQDMLRKHLSHELRRAHYYHLHEWIRIRLGWL